MRLRRELVRSATSSCSVGSAGLSLWAGTALNFSGILDVASLAPAPHEASAQRFEQAIRRQPVRPVQTARRDFAGRPEIRQGRFAGHVDGHAADHVMGPRADWDAIPRDIEPELLTNFG